MNETIRITHALLCRMYRMYVVPYCNVHVILMLTNETLTFRLLVND